MVDKNVNKYLLYASYWSSVNTLSQIEKAGFCVPKASRPLESGKNQ